MAMALVNPPLTHAPSFACTPRTLDIRTGEIGCVERFRVSLWGIRLKRKALNSNNAIDLVTSFLRAQSARAFDHRTIQFERAPPIRCYSEGQGLSRVSQCFVRSTLVFGDEDLARLLVRRGLATSQRFAARYYPSGLTPR